LWTGGIPLLLAFFAFTAVALRGMYRVIRGGRDVVGVAASAAFTATIVIFVLMLFDPHLTVRGSADLFFPLLALAMVDRGRNGLPANRERLGGRPGGDDGPVAASNAEDFNQA
jgi:hypothetical protein